jgi:hypothetical protein
MRVVERSAAVVFPEGLQVQLVEKIEEIDTQIQLGTFALEKWNGRGFYKTCVN